MKAKDCKELILRWQEEGTFDEMLPEVAALRGVPQPEQFHAEGDAYVHTMVAVQAVADDDDPRVLWGTLLHDIGKAETTSFIDGRWRAFGHDLLGARLVPKAMERIGFPELADDVGWLVRHHLFHFSWNIWPGQSLSPRQLRFTREPLFPLLLRLCAADAAGSHGGERKGEVLRTIADAAAGL